MHIVDHIFEKLDGATAIAKGVGLPVQTVHDWLRKGTPEIPPWRRFAVLEFARREGKVDDLKAEALAYLSSDVRAARKERAA